MNLLAIDYGTKNIGLAIAINGVISPLKTIKNNQSLIPQLSEVITQYRIHKIYVGVSYGKIAQLSIQFAKELKKMLQLPVETVEETASTIEAEKIFFTNHGKVKKYRQKIDALSAAVILNRLPI